MHQAERSDAFVFFGMSGDLARKKIFPALYSMVKKGDARHPGDRRGVVAVDARRPAQARAPTASTRTAAASTTRRRSTASPALLRYVDGDYHDPSPSRSSSGELERQAAPGALPRHPADACSRSSSRGSATSGCAEHARVIVEKPFGRDLASATGAQRGAARGVPGGATSSASTTTSARRRSRTSSTSASPTRSSSRSGTATTCARCRSRWPRTSACEGRGALLRGGRRAARRRAEPPVPDASRCSRWSRPSAPRAEELRDAKEDVFKSMRALEPDDLVRGQFDGYRDEDGRRARLRRRDVRRGARLHIDSWRWAGVPFYIRAGKNLPITCTEVRVELHRPPQRVFAEFEPMPHDTNYFRFQLNPRIVDRDRRAGEGRRATASSARSVELYLCNDHAGEESAYERLLGDAMRRRARCCSPARTASRRRGGCVDDVLVDHAPAHPVRACTRGARRSRSASSPTSTTGTTRSRARGRPASPSSRRRADRSLMTVEPIDTPSAPPVRGPVLARGARRRLDRVRRPGRRRPGHGCAGRRRGRGRDAPGAGEPRAPCSATPRRRGPTSPRSTIFLTDLGRFRGGERVVRAPRSGTHRPARSTVQVAALPAGAVVEIECWVYVGPSIT